MAATQRRIVLLTSMLALAIPVSLAFNIDMTNPDVYSGDQKDFFGYKVLQFMSGTNKGIMVSAPLRLNGSGGICKPNPNHQNQSFQCFSPPDISVTDTMIPVKLFGLAVAGDSKRSRFTVCSPSVVHECNGNSYVNSVCYDITDDLQPIDEFKPGFQECTKKTVNLVFLFDGSGSMTEAEFNKNKDFIVEIMSSLKNSSIKFAAVQFASVPRKVFDFNDYEAGRDLQKLKKEPHMKSLTNTHKALTFVLENILENPAAGASPDATKVVVVITDGDPSDKDRNGIIATYDQKSIIRFVIGVKDAKLDKFRAIASDPKDKNAFKIQNYDGLTGVLGNFQNKIFKMEGSKVALAGNLTNELSQSGFSAVVYDDNLIVGSVGSNSWTGSLLNRQEKKETQIQDPDMEMDSYMGYSISVGEKNGAPLYFTGAPRFKHTGRVVLFRKEAKNWTVSQRIDGEQIGSYFGAELCSVDVNSDGNTDFLLVGAPLFYQPQEKKEGQIYVYRLTEEMQLKRDMNVTAASMGRFGSSISSVADLNGDGLRDVAVGAPLEDDNRGCVYIYLGDKHRGVRPTYNQRIMGQNIHPGLRFFGQSIDGDIDLGEDGLPDLVVGSQGTAVVLRSRPVFDVRTRLSFSTQEISTDKIACPSSTDETFPMGNLTACFEMVETTKSKAAAMSSGLNISFTLDVDPTRQIFRGFFSQTDKKARNVTTTAELRDKNTCFSYNIYMAECVKDTLTPIRIKLNFSQVDSESASGVLNVDSEVQDDLEVPFEKHCRQNDICIAELKVDFNFTTPTLLVAENNYFNMSIKLSNDGDDSYYTTLLMYYPPGLSFSRMASKQDKTKRRTLHNCVDLEGVLDRSECGISHPVFRSRSDASFITNFRISNEYEWNDTMSMTIIGKSDNSISTLTNSMTKSIPVQFEIKMAVTLMDDPITYMNFTTEDTGMKEMVTTYMINNLGSKDFPVNVSLFFPTKLEHNFEMTNYQVFVQQNKTQCRGVTDMNSEYCSPEKYCKVIVCDSFTLERYTTVELTLSGDVHFRDLKQQAANIAFLKRYTGDDGEVKFKSFIRVHYDKQRYVLDSYKQQEKSGNDPTVKWTDVRVEFIILPDQMLIILTGAGMGFLLLIIIAVILCKLGFFKRKTLEYYQEQEDEAALFPAKTTNGAVSQSEGKSLLADGEASPPPSDPEDPEKSEYGTTNPSSSADDGAEYGDGNTPPPKPEDSEYHETIQSADDGAE
ncbi:integrin alpha-M-like [Centropristis striata]|uniref:integrin alpha-M-like n=1 Tax=Centropristis striata TaxID=184440 RepID=UPI0027DF1D0D|nr:integrin alpha-M-like [Centropristis striata]